MAAPPGLRPRREVARALGGVGAPRRGARLDAHPRPVDRLLVALPRRGPLGRQGSLAPPAAGDRRPPARPRCRPASPHRPSSPRPQANGESGVAWGQWATLGGVFASGPALVGGDDGTVAVAGRGVDEHLWLRRRTLAKPKPDASPEPVVATTTAAELCPAAPPSAKEPCKQIGLSCGYNEVCCPATTPAAGFCTNTTAVFCRPAIGGNESAVEVLSPAWGEGRWDVRVTSNPHCDRPNPGPSPLPATTTPLSAPLASASAAPSPPCGGAFLTAGPEAVRSGVKETGAPPCGERWEWSEWTDLGGVTTTTPAVERADDGLLRCAPPPPPPPLPRAAAPLAPARPPVVPRSPRRLQRARRLFVRGGDGAINMRAEVRTGEGETGWAPWTSLGAPLGETKTWAC